MLLVSQIVPIKNLWILCTRLMPAFIIKTILKVVLIGNAHLVGTEKQKNLRQRNWLNRLGFSRMGWVQPWLRLSL